MAQERPITVLVTAAGSMPAVGIIRALRGQRELAVRVVSADIYPLSTGRYLSDGFSVVPPATSETYFDAVLKLCLREHVRVVFPILNEEQVVLADQRERFERAGIRVIVNDAEVVRLTVDKYRTYQFCRARAIPTPLTLLPDEVERSALRFPVMVKPRTGSGSAEVFRVDDARELEFFLSRLHEPIVQQFVQGQEYTIDVLTDFAGNVLSVVPKARAATKAGVQVKGCTVCDPRLLAYGEKIAHAFQLAPRANIQCIESGGELHLIEVNPKFPASLALTVAAGVNTPLLLVMMCQGRRIAPMIGKFRDGLVMLRYWQEVFVERTGLSDEDTGDEVFANILARGAGGRAISPAC